MDQRFNGRSGGDDLMQWASVMDNRRDYWQRDCRGLSAALPDGVGLPEWIGLTGGMETDSQRSSGQSLALCVWVLLLLTLPIGFARADTMDEIGYSRLAGLLGDATPNGAGVPISQVEAANSAAYFPATTDIRFSSTTDPFGLAVNFIDGSGGQSNGTTGHATSTVGSNFYGNPNEEDGQPNSLASGANEVTVYEAGHWMEYVLNKRTNRDPLPQYFRVQNSSWVSTSNENESYNRDILLRYDFVIDTNNVTAVVGLNNGTGTLPHLLSHSYNAIAVGRSDGLHSAGLTQSFYGPGRSKPELVAPMGTASAATAVVSSAATMLHEAVAGTEGANSEVMKALLLAGATKDEFTDWDRTHSQPLDGKWGAGELNVYNSYLMTEGGQTVGSTDETGVQVGTGATHGWDYQTVEPTPAPEEGEPVVNQDLFYNLVIPEGSRATELSVLLAWNVEVTDSNDGDFFSGSKSLAGLDLALYDSSTAFLGDLIDESISAVDNVEHIYQTDLDPGTYTLRVSTDSARDFGLAWRLNTLFDEPSADFDEDGDIDGIDFLAWQRGYGILLGAAHAEGDSDGDGDVDHDDLALLRESFGLAPPSQDFGFAPLIASVPEPSTLVLAALVAVAGWAPWRRKVFLGR